MFSCIFIEIIQIILYLFLFISLVDELHLTESRVEFFSILIVILKQNKLKQMHNKMFQKV